MVGDKVFDGECPLLMMEQCLIAVWREHSPNRSGNSPLDFSGLLPFHPPKWFAKHLFGEPIVCGYAYLGLCVFLNELNRGIA